MLLNKGDLIPILILDIVDSQMDTFEYQSLSNMIYMIVVYS